MYLYREKTKRYDAVALMESFELAIKRAREFVGDHNPEDSCSTKRVEVLKNTDKVASFMAERSSSWGYRRATVQIVGPELEELL